MDVKLVEDAKLFLKSVKKLIEKNQCKLVISRKVSYDNKVVSPEQA